MLFLICLFCLFISKKNEILQMRKLTAFAPCPYLQACLRILFAGRFPSFYFEISIKKPVKYCYLTGTKQKTNTMNKH
jgi:hypothetical protein